MLVEIKPLDVKSWHGKTGKDAFTRAKKIQALVDHETMTYRTGLDDSVKSYNHPKEEGVKITEIEYYGILLNKNLNPIVTDKPHEFWDSNLATVKLENHTVILNTNNPLDFIKLRICKASKFVANSLKEYESGLYPEATHVIFDEKEEIEVKASKVEKKHRAIIECSKLTMQRRSQIVTLLSKKYTKHQSQEFMAVELDKLIEYKTDEVLNILNMSVEDMSLQALVYEANFKGFLREMNSNYYYYDTHLGSSMENVVEYLKKAANQDFRIKLMSLVNQQSKS